VVDDHSPIVLRQKPFHVHAFWRRYCEDETIINTPLETCCGCGSTLRADYQSRRTIIRLTGPQKFRLQVRRCHNPHCRRLFRPYRPEIEEWYALPGATFGRDILSLIGNLRYYFHYSGVQQLAIDTIKVYRVPSPKDNFARGRCLCQVMKRSPSVPGVYER
jgi:hypothetical protein